MPSAVIVMLTRTVGGRKQILLQRRQNTGFADGLWDFSFSGHVEHGESMTEAAIREAEEEIGVEIAPSDIDFVALVHKREKQIDLTYLNAYFVCDKFCGQPHICEADKCSQLAWFDIENLPDDLIYDRRKVIEECAKGNNFLQIGW